MHLFTAFSPGDLPTQCRLLLFPHGAGGKLRDIVSAVRPDINIVDHDGAAHDVIVLTEPIWRAQLASFQDARIASSVIILPEVATSYYDWWSFPLELISQMSSGDLCVRCRDFRAFVAGLGTFFGNYVDGRFVDATIRYQPLTRVQGSKRSLQGRVLELLGDQESREDLGAVLIDEPVKLWARWLSRLYDGLEYMDYAVIQPDDVVLNCGVHGGGEIPYFLACLRGQGQLVNIDPLGHDYLSEYSRRSLAAWPGLWTERRIALHDRETVITLPVDESGMAAGGRIGEKIDGLASLTVDGVPIDVIVQELGLKRLDLIKMDIEGAEPRALVGAEKSIRRFRPQLAISIYHQPDHFFEIPMQIAAMVDGYDFFLKSYHFISNETIFYGIPKERPRKSRQNRVRVRLVE
jgi:FkbM family methyltransferase